MNGFENESPIKYWSKCCLLNPEVEKCQNGNTSSSNYTNKIYKEKYLIFPIRKYGYKFKNLFNKLLFYTAY